MPIEVGQEAPDFELPDQNRQKIRLSDFRGKKNVVLVFYPFTFTGVCTAELCGLRDDPGAFETADAQVLAVSCDTPFAQAKFAEEQGYTFPVLSDFWPHGEVDRAYGVFN
jgi:peroxiredoxin